MSDQPRKRIAGYYRKDGTYVRGHHRRRPDFTAPAPARTSSSTGETDLGAVFGAVLVCLFVLGVLARLVG